ncbi:MAG: hypothetical protein J5379_00510 [Clostridiales bacterium]|nr:hypothetical protein [Clostridiales bacterium]
MKLFKKKKTTPSNTIPEVNMESTEVSGQFEPMISMLPKYYSFEYCSFTPLDLLRDELDAYLAKLPKDIIDSEHGDVLDCLIADRARLAFCDLVKQHVERRRTIMNHQTARKSWETFFRADIEHLKEVRKETKDERDEIDRRLKKNKFAEDKHYEKDNSEARK